MLILVNGVLDQFKELKEDLFYLLQIIMEKMIKYAVINGENSFQISNIYQ